MLIFSKFLLGMHNQLIFLLNHLTKKNNIKIDSEETRIQLLSHPYYPSINSITDLFNHFNIDNLALKVENDLKTFLQVPDTFLAQVKENNSNQLVVVLKNNSGVELIYDENKSKNVSIDKFLDLWTGVLIVIEKPETKTIGKSSKINRLKKIVVLLAFISIGYIFFVSQPSIFQIVHFVLSCTAVYISYLIIQHELGLHSKILDKFCSGQSKKTNCDAVLTSKGATIFAVFKLSDVGFVYFTSMVVAWLLFALNGLQSTSVIFILSIVAIPLTFLSIYYQWKVVKNWCPMCLTVVSILWAQFASLFLDTTPLKNIIVFDSSYLLFITSLLAIISLWIFIQPLLKKEQRYEKLVIEHIKFKRNFNLFKAALNLNSEIDTTIALTNELVFGNKSDENLLKIVLITNPMCGYCKESHNLIENILKKEYSEVQITIRFNVNPENIESEGTKIAARILELYDTTNEKSCLYALSDIYGKMDAKTWLYKWGEILNREYITTLKKEKEWCNVNKINFTPAILLNGQQYPKEYDRMDLLYFMDDLIEEQAETSITQPEMVNS